MKYPRPPYKADGIAIREQPMMFTSGIIELPVIEYPITPLENFRLSYKHQTPVWAPMSMLDFDSLMVGFSNTVDVPEGEDAPPPMMWGSTERSEFSDDFGCQWIFVPEAGGPMLRPNAKSVVEDITKWESVVKFPDLKVRDYKTSAEKYMKESYQPGKVMHVNIGQSMTERLVALMGGYTEFLVALMVEPEACRDFFDRFSQYYCDLIDIMFDLYPINMITFHDDWGTEKDTFFSEKVLEDLIFEPTKKFIDRIKSKGDVCVEHHCCGRMERFAPYMIDMGIDMLQIQRRANDIPMLKEKYGDKLGFCCFTEGIEMGADVPREELLAAIRNTVDLYGAKGGNYMLVSGTGPEATWDAFFECYCYSREYYDKERGRDF